MNRVTVFGANGRVGSLVVKELLAKGIHVTAFVHRAKGMTESDKLSIIEGDIHDADAVGRAVSGSGAVISALGSWGTPRKDIQRTGMMHIIPAMREHGIQRIVSLTGSEARAEGDALSVIHRLAHFAAAIGAGKILIDGEVHIKQLETSGLDWTVIRSPIMNERGTDEYTLNDRRPLPWRTINRHAVAGAMVAQLDDEGFVGKAPFINR
jgi:putative NADH-flavin reductase